MRKRGSEVKGLRNMENGLVGKGWKVDFEEDKGWKRKVVDELFWVKVVELWKEFVDFEMIGCMV